MKNIKKIFLLTLLFLTIPLLSACNQEKRDVTISVLTSNYQDGTVLGAATYKEDENITLIANPSFGKSFVAWIKNNKIVSENNEFSFKATLASAGTYTAVFKGENPTYLNPFAMAFKAESLKPEQIVTIQSLSFNFGIGESTQTFNVYTEKELGFGVYENAQTSSIFEFDSDFLLKLRSSFGDQPYTFSANLIYTIGENSVTRNASKTLTLTNLEEKTDLQETVFYQVELLAKDANMQTTIYIWLAPAGTQILSGDIVIS